MRDIFFSKQLIEEINRITKNYKNIFIEDMKTGEYYRIFDINFDKNKNLILKVKSLTELFNS